MKRLTILTIVAVSIVLIAPPTHAEDERKLRGFVAGKLTIGTSSANNGLQILSAVGISMDGHGVICRPPTTVVGDIKGAAEEFIEIAEQLGFRTYDCGNSSEIETVCWYRPSARNNIIVKSINELCLAVNGL